jgi:hypothetical protein
MSKLRPTLGKGNGSPVPDRFDRYYLIREAVKNTRGLIHGQLHDDGYSCPIGSFFNAHPKMALYETTVDEVAAVNDSWPNVSMQTRRQRVLKWLNEKLDWMKAGGK